MELITVTYPIYIPSEDLIDVGLEHGIPNTESDIDNWLELLEDIAIEDGINLIHAYLHTPEWNELSSNAGDAINQDDGPTLDVLIDKALHVKGLIQ